MSKQYNYKEISEIVLEHELVYIEIKNNKFIKINRGKKEKTINTNQNKKLKEFLKEHDGKAPGYILEALFKDLEIEMDHMMSKTLGDPMLNRTSFEDKKNKKVINKEEHELDLNELDSILSMAKLSNQSYKKPEKYKMKKHKMSFKMGRSMAKTNLLSNKTIAKMTLGEDL
jgi:hypothetical protein